MNTYSKPGFFITHAHSEAVESGQAIKLGDQIVVACGKYAASEEGEYARGGVHSLPKAAVAIEKNVKVYWDDTAKKFTNVATDNTLAGVSDAAADSGAAEILVLLNGIPYKYS